MKLWMPHPLCAASPVTLISSGKSFLSRSASGPTSQGRLVNFVTVVFRNWPPMLAPSGTLISHNNVP